VFLVKNNFEIDLKIKTKSLIMMLSESGSKDDSTFADSFYKRGCSKGERFLRE
jgi:hypothetical protein